jgi:hypothetical protein
MRRNELGMTLSSDVDPIPNFLPRDLVSAVVDRLALEADGQVPRRVIAELVGQCHADLQPVSPAAVPELLERLARQRLAYYLREASAWQN